MMDFDGMILFSASKHEERNKLGEAVTEWRKRNASLVVLETQTLQSSDNAFHCVTIAIFYAYKKK
jgi:hypothetical protein